MLYSSFRPLYFLGNTNTYTLSVLDFPIILALCNIANLLECMSMFYFVKRLSAFRIVAEPCADHIPLLGRFAVFLHYALDVGSFGRGEERLVLLRAEMNNRINGSLKDLVCLVKNIGKHVQNMPARFQRTLQQADGHVFLRRGLAHRLADALPLAVLLLLKLPYRLIPFNGK